MAEATPLTLDLKKIVTKVTGVNPKWMFNDKRKSGFRRYKFSGVLNVSTKKITKIKKKISKKYPDLQFVILNDTTTTKNRSFDGLYRGLIVKVFTTSFK